jgi:hypothetical protein
VERTIECSEAMYGQSMIYDALPCRFLGTLWVDTVSVRPYVITNGPSGTRAVATAFKGRMEGPMLNANLVPGVAGGDWVTVRANGTMSLDVRLVLRTDDGADLLMTYLGYARPTDGGDRDIRVAPRFETGDERYAYLNQALCVGYGALDATGVRYHIYEVL